VEPSDGGSDVLGPRLSDSDAELQASAAADYALGGGEEEEEEEEEAQPQLAVPSSGRVR